MCAPNIFTWSGMNYCFSEEQMQNPDYPSDAKIIALKKDHY